MTDTTEQAIESETEVEGTGSDQNKNGKTFTQDDVNKLIAREKASWKRNHDKEKGEWGEVEKDLRTQVTARDEVIQKSVDLLKKDLELDEDFQELLNGMDVLAQYKWLLNKTEKSAKQDIPRTPKAEGQAIKSSAFKRSQTI